MLDFWISRPLAEAVGAVKCTAPDGKRSRGVYTRLHLLLIVGRATPTLSATLRCGGALSRKRAAAIARRRVSATSSARPRLQHVAVPHQEVSILRRRQLSQRSSPLHLTRTFVRLRPRLVVRRCYPARDSKGDRPAFVRTTPNRHALFCGCSYTPARVWVDCERSHQLRRTCESPAGASGRHRHRRCA